MGSIPESERSPGEGNGNPPVYSLGFPGGLDGKESTYNAGDLGLIPGSGRSPGGRNGNPLPYSRPRRGTWRVTVHGVTNSRTQLSD